MLQIFKDLEEMVNSGDPEVRKWFLIRQSYLPFILCGCYAVFSTIVGPAIMKNRKPFKLRKILIAFNFLLVAAYTTCTLTIFWCLTKGTWEEFCKGTAVKKGHISYTFTSSAWWLYILKYVEFLDTVFFILRKKGNLITFLHVLHHTVVPILGWILIRTENNGLQIIPGLINACVHIVMYTYYGLAAMGPKYRKYIWWKKYLTQLQIYQFILMIFFLNVISPFLGCSMAKMSFVAEMIIIPFHLYLFYKFYQAAFRSQKVPQANGVEKKNDREVAGCGKQ